MKKKINKEKNKALWQWCSFFADLPPDRRGESCPHIGILGGIQRETFMQVVILATPAIYLNINWNYIIYGRDLVCVCVCAWTWFCTTAVLGAAVLSNSGLDQSETRCTANSGLWAQVDIADCTNTWEKVQAWLWRQSGKHTCSPLGTLTTIVMRTAAVGVVDIHSQDFSAWTHWNGFNARLTHYADRKHRRGNLTLLV